MLRISARGLAILVAAAAVACTPPDSDYTVTIGQVEPDNLEPRNFAVCTY